MKEPGRLLTPGSDVIPSLVLCPALLTLIKYRKNSTADIAALVRLSALVRYKLDSTVHPAPYTRPSA